MLCMQCGEGAAASPCAACGDEATLAGRYTVEAVIGRGARAITWRARRLSDGAAVAVKEVPLGRVTAPKERELAFREARVLAQLDHPGVPRLYEHFVWRRSLWIVEEHVEGVTLEQELRTRRYSEADALCVAEELVSVLAYLHALSPPVVHRDIKPANVIRRPGGGLCLVDFGSVREAAVDPDLGGLTVSGTFGYMAPEQFRGDASPATDFYAVGALLVALLSRRAPHELLSHARLCWRPHLTVSPGVGRLLDALLHADPERRVRTAGEARALLRRARQVRAPSRTPEELVAAISPAGDARVPDVAPVAWRAPEPVRAASRAPEPVRAAWRAPEPVRAVAPPRAEAPSVGVKEPEPAAFDEPFFHPPATLPDDRPIPPCPKPIGDLLAIVAGALMFVVPLLGASPSHAAFEPWFSRPVAAEALPPDLRAIAEHYRADPAVNSCLVYHRAAEPHAPAPTLAISYDPREYAGWRARVGATSAPLLACLRAAVREVAPMKVGGHYRIAFLLD